MTHARTTTRSRPSAPLLLLLLGIGFATEVHAESNAVRKYLFAAARLYEDLDYERALAQVRKAKAIAETPEDDVQVSLWEGVIAARSPPEGGDRRVPCGALLDPNAELPVKVSPKVTEDFERLRAQALAEASAAKGPTPQTVRSARWSHPSQRTPPLRRLPPTPPRPPWRAPPAVRSSFRSGSAGWRSRPVAPARSSG